MNKLVFRDNPKALKKLSKVQGEIDSFIKKHPGKMTDRQHKRLRKLFSKRASALSDATGLKIHSLFD